jgi:hypothetical protein
MDKTKRGRRPKKQSGIIDEKPIDTPIIAHLPIHVSENSEETENDTDIFLPAENTNTLQTNTIKKYETEIKQLKKRIEELTQQENKPEINLKPATLECNNTSYCWWDKLPFNTPPIEMPESYYNGIFSCIGKFCSWECMMAYNIDINDENISKRTSLIHHMYKNTYNMNRVINPAPSWKILDCFGGAVSIDIFRENLTNNSVNYHYIKPPMISRISHIEKTPIKKDIEIVQNDNIVLKRSKPLKTTKYNLKQIMGLKINQS